MSFELRIADRLLGIAGSQPIGKSPRDLFEPVNNLLIAISGSITVVHARATRQLASRLRWGVKVILHRRSLQGDDAAPPRSMMNSRRLSARPKAKDEDKVEYSRSGPCTAAKGIRFCPVGVKSVGSTRPTSSRHVRCASDSSRIGALQRFDEECQLLTHALQ